MTKSVVIIGCGFVADLYMSGLRTFDDIAVLGAWDRDPARLKAFADHWGAPTFEGLGTALAALPGDGLVLNLTNPSSHFDISKQCLSAGHHVFSEKPMVLDMDHARALTDLARAHGVQLGSAPSSVLGEAAQTVMYGLRTGVAGVPRLIYAELDDGFIPQAPLEAWQSESGAPWPYGDEFRTGCTLEHAGYYLSWLIAAFGPVRRIVSSAAQTLPDDMPEKRGVTDVAPDFSVGVIYFKDGPPVRLTCSITAPHDHRLRVFGDRGVLSVDKAWDNSAKVRFYRRLRIRRRLLEAPVGRRIRLSGPTHPKVGRKGAAAMNFALGPAEMLDAIAENRVSRIAGDYALHLTEATLALQSPDPGGVHEMTTGCERMEPMPWAR